MNNSVFDLTNLGYLGLRHAWEELRVWECLSKGRPLALHEVDPFTDALVARIAALQGCERALFATSTFQLFCDLFGLLSEEEVVIYLEEGTYPIAQWGVERAAAQGVTVLSFRHQSLESLNSLLSQSPSTNKRPVVVVDGVSSTYWSPNPLSEYLKAIEPFGGLLVVDDTQALGLLGHSPDPQAPFGLGGGGSLRWHELESPNVICVSSLAKGFGVPIAVFSGSTQMIKWFRANSQTLEHCSPPCTPLLHAVEHALDVNESEGDELRARLSANIKSFQTIWQEAGFSELGSLFPIQSIDLPEGTNPVFFEEELQARGVRVLLQQSGNDRTRVVLGITAEHSLAEVENSAHVLVETFEELMNTQ